MKEIVIINGSPRRDGNTSTLLNAVARGVEDGGAAVQFYTLFKMKYMACQGCFHCRINDDCIIRDGLHELLQSIKAAHGVVVGSPVYMMQMTGPVKNMYDRIFALTDSDYNPRFGTKKTLTVYSQGYDDPHMFESYFEYTAAMFPALGFNLIDNIVSTNGNDPESAERNAQLKIRAYEAGKKLAF
ncbi:MAG: flavodoxin family protein [Desulfofustis sp.]|nr:flavodoxin family protein [Desulfofustis sp.]MBT8355012.1 flavodoxin family protein [Desulfofustis sp.]NNF45494.1 flavodoxin family protein [Desulfofustis sp.]NNK56300.1 flavodoxin family protein [Desulfofustis sp.]